MKRFLAIIPLGFALFFTVAALGCGWHVLHPDFGNEERVLAFGVGWVQACGAIAFWYFTINLIRTGNPW